MQDSEIELHEAVNDALGELAVKLGGTTDIGGPVENATQIKGRGDLGILLTDAQDRVLGRVWIEFGGSAELGELASSLGAGGLPRPQQGSVGVATEVLWEIVDPPVPLDRWAEGK